MKVRIIIAVVLVGLTKMSVVAAPLLYKRVIDSISGPSLAAAPILLIVGHGVTYIGAQLLSSLRQLVFAPAAQAALRSLAGAALSHLHALSLRFHIERQTGGVSRIIDRGTAAIDFLLEVVLFNSVPTVLELAAVALILLHLYSPAYSLAVFATIFAYASLTFVLTQRQVHARREMNSRDVAASVMAIDGLLNYETVKYFGAEAREVERFDEARRAYAKAAVRSQVAQSLLASAQAVVILTGLIIIMLMSASDVAHHRMTVGDFVLINSYLLQLYAPLGALAMLYSNIRRSTADLEAMLSLLATPPEVRDRDDAASIVISTGHVRFERVSFSYDRRRPILRDISFEVPPGRTVAIVGPSGSGKSTIARLLFRFYDPEDGLIMIDGHDIRDITQSSLRAAIGVVPQDTVLFNDSLAYNIAYGRDAASPAEVEAAATAARLDQTITRLPDGYQTRVGERGLKLSGGEKQRVAIARVVIKRPAILIFDEATSALDVRTEREIQRNLEQISESRTTLAIAHRLSTIVHADEILVLDQGRIVERGSHSVLLGLGGLYAAMWEQQRYASERAAPKA